MSCFNPRTSPKRKRGVTLNPRLRFGLVGLLCVLCAAPPVQGQEPRRVTNQRDFLQPLQWSPDGKHFLVTRIHAGKMGLWTVDVDGKQWKRLLPADAEPH